MLPLNNCQDSDSLEMHGMLVIYYEPPTPTELHFKYKARLVFFFFFFGPAQTTHVGGGEGGERWGCKWVEVRSIL